MKENLKNATGKNERRIPVLHRKVAFTLAEVLITLAIIGVVAAMTLPTLIANINDKVTENQEKVLKSKLVDGLNLFNTQENGLSVQYDSTYDFLQALSKHYKMAKICSQDELQNCLMYPNLNYEESDELKSVEVSKLKSRLKFPDNFLEPAGFVSGDGTPFIVSFSKDCGALSPDSVDPDKKFSWKAGIPACLAGIYDLNGTRKPNKLNKDVKTFNGAKLGAGCKKFADLCFITGINITPLSKAECEDQKENLGIKACPYDDDYWAGAVRACKDAGGSLPSGAQLAAIANEIYGVTDIGAKTNKDGLSGTKNISDAISDLGLRDTAVSGPAEFYLWSSEESSDDGAYGRNFLSTSSHWNGVHRFYDFIQAVCISN